MPASLATLLTILLVVALYVWDGRRKDVSSALWLPVLWIVVTGSRFPSQWLQLGDPAAVANVADGSPMDATYFAALIVCGLIVLLRRGALSGDLVRRNLWLIALLAYGLMSILWSDFPFIALKRWVKVLGHPVMALIVLTEASPADAFRVVMKRCAFFLLPASVLFIKYLPEYGRGFDRWTGEGYFQGVGLTKNDLGYVCVVFGLFFLWNILSRHRIIDAREQRSDLVLSVAFLAIVAWLMVVSNSATSLVTFSVGALTMIGLGTRFVSKRFLGTYLVAAAVVAIGVELTFDVYEKVIGLLGRDPTLTDRTQIWSDAIALQTKPLIGMGFESFWLGSRLDWMSAKWWWHPNQAHSGYVETYLNLGFIGLGLLLGVLVSTFRRITARLPSDFEFSRLRLALLFAILTHNYTEATFKGVHLLWTMFYFVALDCRPKPANKETEVRAGPSMPRRGMWPRGNDSRKTGASGATTPYRSRMR